MSKPVSKPRPTFHKLYGMTLPQENNFAFNWELKKPSYQHLIEDATNRLGHFPSKRYYGIEVEVENVAPLLNFGSINGTLLRVEIDHSLRNEGRELISCPMKGDDIPLFLHLIYSAIPEKYLKNAFCWRTGLHVHCDVTQWNVVDLLKFFLVYLYVEPFVFKDIKDRFGVDRRFSVYTTPWNDMSISNELQWTYSTIRRKDNPDVNDSLLVSQFFDFLKVSSDYRYVALNYANIPTIGTIEWRMFPGTTDPLDIMRWMSMIDNTLNYVEKHSLEEICDTLSILNTSSGYVDTYKQILGTAVELSPSLFRELEKSVANIKILLSNYKVPTRGAPVNPLMNKFILDIHRKKAADQSIYKFSVDLIPDTIADTPPPPTPPTTLDITPTWENIILEQDLAEETLNEVFNDDNNEF